VLARAQVVHEVFVWRDRVLGEAALDKAQLTDVRLDIVVFLYAAGFRVDSERTWVVSFRRRLVSVFGCVFGL